MRYDPDHPLVSVLVASYNHAAYIEEAIESIWAQSYPNIEIIVVDDCSTDTSWTLLQKLVSRTPVPMRIFLNSSNQGPAKTFNNALAEARGDLIAFLASDDLYTENRFEHSVHLFLKNKSLKAVYANGRTWDGTSAGDRIHKLKAIELLTRSHIDISKFLYVNSSPLFIQAALFQKEALELIGGFNTDLLADDWLLNAKLFASFTKDENFVYLDEDVVLYRQHPTNIHKNYERHERLKIEFIEKCTPEHLKAEGFSNIYYWAARKRLKRGEFVISWRYFLLSQQYCFHFSRLSFISTIIKNYFYKMRA